jgi:hypothetical protein
MKTIKFKHWVLHTKRKKMIESYHQTAMYLDKLIWEVIQKRADENRKAAESI